MHFDLMNKISSRDLVACLPKIKFSKDKFRYACQMRKKMRVSFQSKKIVSISKPLELIQLNLFDPSRVRSLGGNYYVIVDYYSRFTWTLLLTHKDEKF